MVVSGGLFLRSGDMSGCISKTNKIKLCCNNNKNLQTICPKPILLSAPNHSPKPILLRKLISASHWWNLLTSFQKRIYLHGLLQDSNIFLSPWNKHSLKFLQRKKTSYLHNSKNVKFLCCRAWKSIAHKKKSGEVNLEFLVWVICHSGLLSPENSPMCLHSWNWPDQQRLLAVKCTFKVKCWIISTAMKVMK